MEKLTEAEKQEIWHSEIRSIEESVEYVINDRITAERKRIMDGIPSNWSCNPPDCATCCLLKEVRKIIGS